MTTHYQHGRTLAITCGLAATGGALAILLADPVTTGNWRLDHVLLPVVVSITIAAGHLCGSALRGWRILPGLGFALVFCIGTLLTVYSSVGAQKSGAGARQVAEVAYHNGAISEKRAEIEHARVRARQAQAMADKEMTGERCGPRCKDWRLREQEVQARIAKLEGELQGMGAPQVAPSKARPFAEALGVLGFDAAKVEKVAATFEPFAFSLLFELTAIIAFGYGFAAKRRQPEPDGVKWEPVDLTPQPEEQDNVLNFCKAFKAANGRAPTIPEVQSKFPDCPKTTAWRRARAA